MRAYKMVVEFSLLLVALLGLQLLASPAKASEITAEVNIVPEMFNLKRLDEQSGVITAYVSNLTKEGVSYNVRDINLSTVGLYYGESPVAEALRTIVANDVLIVKFDASTVANYIWFNILYHMGTIPPQDSKLVPLTLRGQLNNGEKFAGTDTIKAMFP
jgi:hypothetical protein